jgi:hypothetical protein
MAITNVSKVSSGETWASITTTWATEPRTWLAASQLLDNVSRVSSSIINGLKSFNTLWDDSFADWDGGFIAWDKSGDSITNTSKPN